MATYVLLTSLTPEGRQTLHKNPDRLIEVNREVEQFGCRIISQYAILGPYDFLTIIEAPDNETAAHLAVDLGSRGSVIPTTFPAMNIEDFVGNLKESKQLGTP